MAGKKVLRNYDWVLLAAIILLGLFGLVMVAASTNPGDASWTDIISSRHVSRQALFLAVAVACIVGLSFLDYNEWRRFLVPIYVFNFLLLLLVLVRGQEGLLGAQRWIQLGFFTLQPSELAKVVIILTLAIIMSKENRSLESWLDLAVPLAHVGLPMALIFLQPDLGTSLVFIAITGGILFVAGLRWLHLGVLSLAGAIGGVLAFFYAFKPYQQNRLIIFLDPWQDLHSGGWQIIQSKVAVGSGQFWGRGLFQGTQNQLNFLPEKHTDFIFSVVGEELGFVGAAALLVFYLFVIWRVFKIGVEAKDMLGRYICVGVASMLLFQLVVNVGMTISIMPVTGLPLPLISYGGSSLLATAIALGLVLSVAAHKDTSMF